MPHIQIDYSPNLAARLDVAGLCHVLRDASMATGVQPLAGIRVRATACDHVVIADGNRDHAFMDISIRLRAGRTPEDKARATAMIPPAAEGFCAGVMQTSGDVNTQTGMASHMYLVNASMQEEYFFSADGELLVVP